MEAGTPLFGGRHKSRKGETKKSGYHSFSCFKRRDTGKKNPVSTIFIRLSSRTFWEKRKNSFVRVGTLTLRNVLRRMENGFFFYVQTEDRKNLG